uniref:Uncharacterized protein n=1 Tax=Rhizophora mucronata TaxID=61149 RepID=A0A2P2MCH0_RHIMU
MENLIKAKKAKICIQTVCLRRNLTKTKTTPENFYFVQHINSNNRYVNQTTAIHEFQFTRSN